MAYLPPKFWQFYARSVVWVGVILLPLLWLYNYLHSLNWPVPFLTKGVDVIFSLGYLIINLSCHWGTGCITAGMGWKETSFFAYFFSVLIVAFFIALYRAWTWTPNKPKAVAEPPKKDEFDY